MTPSGFVRIIISMPTLINVSCVNCGVVFSKSLKRYNESLKNNWKFYCSKRCQSERKKLGEYLICSNPECSARFYRAKNDINSRNNFCSSNCSAKFSNRNRAIKHKCLSPSCNNLIRKSRSYCSNSCQGDALRIPVEIRKKKVVKKINAFIKMHGRIPVKREMSGTYNSARKSFGTWNKAIRAAGYKPNPVLFAYKHTAKDGHKCDSFAEMIIDNWLYEYGIPHKINVSYPVNENLTVDFKIADYWVEFFGLVGDLKKYDLSMVRKLEIAKQENLKLIKIYPKDMFPEHKLEYILESVLLRYAKAFVCI